jgi:hypothetical protein
MYILYSEGDLNKLRERGLRHGKIRIVLFPRRFPPARGDVSMGGRPQPSQAISPPELIDSICGLGLPDMLQRNVTPTEIRYGKPAAITVVTDTTDMKSVGIEG